MAKPSLLWNGRRDSEREKMKVISLLYHDVVSPGAFDASGFSGGDAHIYKLELPELNGMWKQFTLLLEDRQLRPTRSKSFRPGSRADLR